MRAAAIVNGDARHLGSRLRERLERALPGGVVLAPSLEHARRAIRAEVARGVDLIVLGGGDGAVVMGLALIAEACRGAGRPEPAIGVLRLGAGDAIADAVGASSDAASDLARLARGEGAWRSIRMLRALGVRAPFVGAGLDARRHEDRAAVARLVDRIDRISGGIPGRLPGARRLVGGAARSALSIARRSVDRIAAPPRVRAVITNLGAPAIELERGRPTGRQIAAGDAIWEGPCGLVAGSTIPYLGLGARRPSPAGARGDRFYLRCGETGAIADPAAAPERGRGPGGLRDFLCDHVEIRLDGELSFQAGGELLGLHRGLEIELGEPVTVASLVAEPE